MSIGDRYPFVRPCPCGSGASAHACCYSATEAWRKTPTSLTPSGPTTGTSNPRCYMRSTQNCSSRTSREHYISRNVLAAMEKEGTSKISGAPWQSPREVRIVPTASLVSKLLCKRHNESLSSLDSEAGRLIKDDRNIRPWVQRRKSAPRDDPLLRRRSRAVDAQDRMQHGGGKTNSPRWNRPECGDLHEVGLHTVGR
jgi:hypothetical protein